MEEKIRTSQDEEPYELFTKESARSKCLDGEIEKKTHIFNELVGNIVNTRLSK